VGSVVRSIRALFSKVALLFEEAEQCLNTAMGAKIAEIVQEMR